MFRRWFCNSKAGQDKSIRSAVRRQQGLVGALDLFDRVFSLAFLFVRFLLFVYLQLDFTILSASHSKCRSLICWHSAVGGSEALEGYRVLGRSFNIFPLSVSVCFAMSCGDLIGLRLPASSIVKMVPSLSTTASLCWFAAIPSHPSSIVHSLLFTNCYKSTHTCRRMYP